MDKKFKQITTLMMDIGEVKRNSEIFQSNRLNKRRGREAANETTIIPNIFANTKIHS